MIQHAPAQPRKRVRSASLAIEGLAIDYKNRGIIMKSDKAIFQGIFPAFYACYDRRGEIDVKRVEELTAFLVKKGVKGVYVGGSSGECIYQSTEERKLVLEHVMKAAGGRLTVIAHVACNNTYDSCILAAHAQSLGVDAIAAIPPIYFHLPEYAIAEYWNDISAAAPDTEFIIYNIPQLAGVTLTMPLLREMLKNPRLRGVKNSSMSVLDIQQFKQAGGEDFIVFNGPDEQLAAGLIMGADGGIGGTYGAMPELYIKIHELFKQGNLKDAMELQKIVSGLIALMSECKGNLYAVLKEILRIRAGIDIGSVRKPLTPLLETDMAIVKKCAERIEAVVRNA